MGYARRINKWGVLFGTGAILIALVLSLWISFSELDFYRSFRESRKDYEYIGKNAEELEGITKDLIRYLQFGGEERLERHFNEREILHMRDVRFLVGLTVPILGIGVLFCGFSLWRKGGGHYSSFYAGAAGTMTVILIVFALAGIAMALSFDTAFVRFHEIFFWNDLWILDPRTDLMIRMLPQDLFVYLFLRILMLFVLFCGLAIAVLVRRKYGLYTND